MNGCYRVSICYKLSKAWRSNLSSKHTINFISWGINTDSNLLAYKTATSALALHIDSSIFVEIIFKPLKINTDWYMYH